MQNKPTPGKRFRLALQQEQPLQIVGTINAYCALLAEHAGFKAIYLSGAGVANASYGLPDLGMTTLNDVLEDIRRITSITDLPLLVDADTGWGDILNIKRTVKEFIRAGAAGLHLEDQVTTKRCGHRPGKVLVETDVMIARIQAANDAKTDPDFIIMARTDALAVEGLDAAIERAQRYVANGAEMIFAEAVQTLEEYQMFSDSIGVPILANITEFGKTPLYSVSELKNAGVSMILYPLSAFRAMSAAAEKVYSTIRTQGTQKNVLDIMQTRSDLYEHLNYMQYEELVDKYVPQK